MCQDCQNWLDTNPKAQEQFSKCDKYSFFSSDMQQVCEFDMPVQLPSGMVTDFMCPPWNSGVCPGPMKQTLDSSGDFLPYITKEECVKLDWGEHPNYSAQSRYENLSSRNNNLNPKERKELQLLERCQQLH